MEIDQYPSAGHAKRRIEQPLLLCAVQKVKWPMDELFVEAIVAAAPTLADASTNLNVPLAQMTYLNDAALWQAARSTLMPEQRERLAVLHEAQQQRSLSGEEQAEEQALLKLYREVVLVRAQAAVLLKQCGYDVSDTNQVESLE